MNFEKNKIYDLELKIIKITNHPITNNIGIYGKDADDVMFQINTEFGTFDNAISKLHAGDYINILAKFYKIDVSERGERFIFFLKDIVNEDVKEVVL